MVFLCQELFGWSTNLSAEESRTASSADVDYDNSKLNDFYKDTWASSVQDGWIMLFPPHLTHGIKVGIENRNKMRLTFSFNLAIDGVLLPT